MRNLTYQQQSVAGKNSVELIVALYDGMIRFLHRAIAATEAGDMRGKRIAVKRVFDILVHLQSRLRMDVSGPAKTLSEFYSVIFALCLEGSRLSSVDRFRKAIECILEVREAWQQVAQDPEVQRLFTASTSIPVHVAASVGAEAEKALTSGWTA